MTKQNLIRLSSAFILALSGVVVLIASTHVMTKMHPSQPKKPIIFLESAEVDFGRLKPLSRTQKELKIENRGSLPLLMQTPTATCGCQTPVLASSSIEPGGHTTLTLSQHASNDTGPFRHMVTLRSNDLDHPEIRVALGGVVTRGIEIRPEPIIFEPIGLGESAVKTFEVSSDNGVAFRITHLHSSGHLTAKATLNHLSPVHKIEVAVRGGTQAGRFQEFIKLNTDFPDGEPLLVRVEGEVQGPIHINPSTLSIGSANSSSVAKRTVIITSTSRRFIVKSVYPPEGGWKVSFRQPNRPQSQRHQLLELTIRGPNAPGLVSGKIRLELQLDGANTEIIEIPISGVIIPELRPAPTGGISDATQ